MELEQEKIMFMVSEGKIILFSDEEDVMGFAWKFICGKDELPTFARVEKRVEVDLDMLVPGKYKIRVFPIINDETCHERMVEKTFNVNEKGVVSVYGPTFTPKIGLSIEQTALDDA